MGRMDTEHGVRQSVERKILFGQIVLVGAFLRFVYSYSAYICEKVRCDFISSSVWEGDIFFTARYSVIG